MSHDTRSAAEIERDIEQERAALSQSLNALQEKFSVEGIARQLVDQVSRHGGDVAQSVGRSAKENPIALALTGIGLAWMMYGDCRRNSSNGTVSHTGSTSSATDSLKHASGTIKGGASSATSSASSAMSSMGSAASDRWDRMSDQVDHLGRRTRASAEDMRRRLHEGPENMSAAARDRVVKGSPGQHQWM